MMSGEALGEAVVIESARLAQLRWATRLRAAYALGSLAHGGFSSLVSDVDLGLILDGPLEEGDAAGVRELAAKVAASGLPLSDRLSVFWGTHQTLSGSASGGRFPPLDRLDLIMHGRLLAGKDVRARLPRPAQSQLVVDSARLGLDLMERPSYRAWLKDPASLLDAEPKPLTKAVLFPVRFLYTARTGEIGRNHDAVAHLVSTEPGPVGNLAAAALRWRDEPPAPNDAAARALVEAGLRPVYRLFAAEHETRMAEYGEAALAARLARAQRTLDSLT